LLHIMHLFPSDRPPSILFAKKFRIHDSFIATPLQKMRGTLSPLAALGENYNDCRRPSKGAFLLAGSRLWPESEARAAALATGYGGAPVAAGHEARQLDLARCRGLCRCLAFPLIGEDRKVPGAARFVAHVRLK
jgi:hypothetical protein